jgi:hypothetical protein
MNPHQLYECVNTVATDVLYDKHAPLKIKSSSEGICKGQAIVWCRNMLDGISPALTKPSYQRAAALQVIFERSGSESAFRQASMVPTNIQGNVYTLFWHITHNAGVYQIRIDGHALAAANQNHKSYFFNADEGLYEYEAAVDFNKKMLERPRLYREMWSLVGS